MALHIGRLSDDGRHIVCDIFRKHLFYQIVFAHTFSSYGAANLFGKEMAAAPLVSPSLNFDTIYNDLQTHLQPPPAKALAQTPIWTLDGPVTAVKFLKNFFGNRLANYPGKGGAIRSPRQYAKMLHRYILRAKQPAAVGHHDRFQRSLRDIISLVCQNPRAGRCTRNSPVLRAGKNALMPYLTRQINPGCSVASAALFSILYNRTGVAMPHLNASNAKNIARNVSFALTSRRRKNAAGIFSPSATCACLNRAACVGMDPACSWVVPPVGPAVPGFPTTATCLPANSKLLGSDGFPGVAKFAGQRFPVASKAGTQQRPGTSYSKNTGTYWMRPTVGPLPLQPVSEAGLAWP